METISKREFVIIIIIIYLLLLFIIILLLLFIIVIIFIIIIINISYLLSTLYSNKLDLDFLHKSQINILFTLLK